MKRQPWSKRRWLRLAALFAAGSLAVTACGGRGDDDDASDDTDTDTGEPGEAGAPGEGPGFDGETIRLGVITPTSGPVADIGNALTAGNQAYFEALNAEGGVAGEYEVELDIRDSQYTDTVAAQEYDAIKEDVVMFAQILGTPIITTLLESLEADNMVAGPATLDAEWVRSQHLLPIGAPYQVQAANAVDYWINEMDGEGTNICAEIQDDPYGEAGLQGLEAAVDAHGMELVEVQRHSLLNEDFTPQVTALQNADCDMVFLVAVPFDVPGLFSKVVELDFQTQWFGQSPTWEGTGAYARGDFGPYLEENFIWAADGVEYGDESVDAMADLVAAQEGSDSDPDVYFNFGYAQAWAVTQVLEAAVENGDLSRDGIIDAMNGLEQITVGGLFGDYEWGAPEDRNPPRGTSFFSVNPDEPLGLELLGEPYYTSEVAENLDL